MVTGWYLCRVHLAETISAIAGTAREPSVSAVAANAERIIGFLKVALIIMAVWNSMIAFLHSFSERL